MNVLAALPAFAVVHGSGAQKQLQHSVTLARRRAVVHGGSADPAV